MIFNMSKKTVGQIVWNNKSLLFEKQEMSIKDYNKQSIKLCDKQALKVWTFDQNQEFSYGYRSSTQNLFIDNNEDKINLLWWSENTIDITVEKQLQDNNAETIKIIIKATFEVNINDLPSQDSYSKSELEQDIISKISLEPSKENLKVVGFTFIKFDFESINLTEKKALETYLKFIENKKNQQNDFDLKSSLNDFLIEKEIKENDKKITIDLATKKVLLKIFEDEQKLKLHLKSLELDKKYQEQINLLNLQKINLDIEQRKALTEQINSQIQIAKNESNANIDNLLNEQTHQHDLKKKEQDHRHKTDDKILDTKEKSEQSSQEHKQSEEDKATSNKFEIDKANNTAKNEIEVLDAQSENRENEEKLKIEGKVKLVDKVAEKGGAVGILLEPDRQKICKVTLETNLENVVVRVLNQNGDYDKKGKTKKIDGEITLKFNLEYGTHSFKLIYVGNNLAHKNEEIVFNYTVGGVESWIERPNFLSNKIKEIDKSTQKNIPSQKINNSQKLLYLNYNKQKYFILANTKCVFGVCSKGIHGQKSEARDRFLNSYKFNPVFSDFFIDISQAETNISDYQAELKQIDNKIEWRDFSTLGTNFKTTGGTKNSFIKNDSKINTQKVNVSKIENGSNDSIRKAGLLQDIANEVFLDMGNDEAHMKMSQLKNKSVVIKRLCKDYKHTYILMPDCFEIENFIIFYENGYKIKKDNEIIDLIDKGSLPDGIEYKVLNKNQDNDYHKYFMES
ncbi:MAG: hypothetical protein COB02_04765 [Candidatus Cloacimonadota bacterium]|nr:MAG: hypothetical protein COB02_04765 [Candidatus Cloacimonadota bacterium]